MIIFTPEEFEGKSTEEILKMVAAKDLRLSQAFYRVANETSSKYWSIGVFSDGRSESIEAFKTQSEATTSASSEEDNYDFTYIDTIQAGSTELDHAIDNLLDSELNSKLGEIYTSDVEVKEIGNIPLTVKKYKTAISTKLEDYVLIHSTEQNLEWLYNTFIDTYINFEFSLFNTIQVKNYFLKKAGIELFDDEVEVDDIIESIVNQDIITMLQCKVFIDYMEEEFSIDLSSIESDILEKFLNNDKLGGYTLIVEAYPEELKDFAPYSISDTINGDYSNIADYLTTDMPTTDEMLETGITDEKLAIDYIASSFTSDDVRYVVVVKALNDYAFDF